jgi:pilus assembly protein CpaF
MELHERISTGRSPASQQEPFADLKNRVHMAVISELGPQLFNIAIDPTELRNRVTADIRRHLNDEAGLAREDRERLTAEILDDILGYGPLERLLADDSITEIMCNGPDDVWIERGGKLYETTVRFTDESHLRRIINKIVSQIGRRIDEASPMVDARLPDGSRVNAIIPPLSLTGPLLTIRKFSKRRLSMEDMVNIGSLSEESVEFLSRCIEAQLNMLISGGTGSGKTTLLNALSASIPNSERIVTIEDAAELQLHQRHVLRLEARPPNIEGEGHIPIRDLVRNSLRMRPDRIIVGEVRGAEALDMLQAMNTGHDGSLSTVHSNSPRDGLHRIETMVMMAGYDLPLRAIRQHVAAALDLLVHIDRMEDGSRRVTGVTEVLRMESDVIQLQDIFEFEIQSVAPDRTITGGLRPTGLRPVFLEKFRKRGIELPQSMFGERITVLDDRRGALG